VNEFMQTGAPDVYAAGDIAYFPFKHGSTASFLTRIEHWDVAFDQGRIAALNMLKSASTPYDGIPFFWTMSMGKSLRYAGHCHKFERVIIHGATAAPEDTFAVYYIAEGKVVAVATVGRDPVAVAVMELLRLDRLPAPAVLDSNPTFDLPAYLTQQSLDVAMGTSAATVK
jgi:NADPH-dependent 2,4-dienoyl-CoA reductase/sulfur reductase-like enzyme